MAKLFQYLLRLVTLTLSLFLLAITSLPATTAGPMQVLEAAFSELTTTLSKSHLSSKEEQELIVASIKPLFDIPEMSVRSLASNWKKATPEQRAEFIALFEQMLLNTYSSRLRKIKDSRVSFIREDIRDHYAVVYSTILYEGEDYSFSYKLHNKHQGKWLIYDIVAANVGLVTNYRGEFAAIIRKSGIAGLLSKMRKKVK